MEVGVTPHDLAISPDHKTVYTPVYGDGVCGRNPHPAHTVAIIDLPTRAATAIIDVSPYQAPHGIQIDNASILYVTCDLSRKLLVIDLRARKMTGRVPAPNGTEGIVASPDGRRVLVADHAEPAIFVIDTAADTVVDKIAMKGNTKGMYKVRYALDGTSVLALNSAEGLINIFSASNLHGEQTVFTVGKAPMGFAFSPNGTVSVIDLHKLQVISSFVGGTGIETLSYY